MVVTIIVPPYKSIIDSYSKHDEQNIIRFSVPYGALSIASYIKKVCKVKILDLNIEDNIKPDYIKDALVEKLTVSDIIGICTPFDSSYGWVKMISENVRSMYPDTILIAGGPLATHKYEYLLNQLPIDGICISEGEIPMLDLVSSDEPKRVLRIHKSWITKEGLSDNKIPQPSIVEDLDTIPLIDYSMVEIEKYPGRSTPTSITSVVELPIHTTRGCPFNCNFCSNPSLHGKKVRKMSLEKTVREIDNILSFKCRTLLIEDDNFLLDKERASAILSHISRLGIKTEFPNGISVRAIDDQVAKLLKNAGVKTVHLAVESCSDYVLQHIMNKPHNVKLITQARNILKDNGLRVRAFIVMGLPNETDKHRYETIYNLIQLQFDWVYFFMAIPISGSPLEAYCESNGFLLSNDLDKRTINYPLIQCKNVNPETIQDELRAFHVFVNLMNGNNVTLERLELLHSRYPHDPFIYKALADRYIHIDQDDKYSHYNKLWIDNKHRVSHILEIVSKINTSIST